MTDDRLERELRELLVARAPIGASVALRTRLAAVPAEAGATGPRWWTRWLDVRRGVAGTLATAALAVLVIVVLSRLGQATARDPDAVGGQTSVPIAPTAAPFVTAPDGFFTSGALADAQERLGRVFTATGIEATLVVTPTANIDELTTPPGWPEGFDRDHDGSRDVTAVAGITPDQRIVCCLTITGSALDQVRQYWRPIAAPSALDDDLAGATADERDVALDLFVVGIEGLATTVTKLGLDPHPADVVVGWMPVVFLLGFAALIIAALPRRRSMVGSSPTGVDAVVSDVGSSESPPAPADIDVREPGAMRPARSGRTLLLAALAALGAIGAATLFDALRPNGPFVPMDPTRQTVVLVDPTSPIIPVGLAAIALVSLLAYAARGGWRRRLGVIGLLVCFAVATSVSTDLTRPTQRDIDVSWASSPNLKEQTPVAGGIGEFLRYDLAPGETFILTGVIQNRGVLPMTLLGLGYEVPTGANPYVASIVGLGWVPQPVDDGRVHLLSAAPESISTSWPLMLRPGQEAAVAVLVRAGPCAQPGGTGSVLPLTTVPLTYRVLGVERTEVVGLPASAFVSAKDTCTVELPDRTVTYGPVPSP